MGDCKCSKQLRTPHLIYRFKYLLKGLLSSQLSEVGEGASEWLVQGHPGSFRAMEGFEPSPSGSQFSSLTTIRTWLSFSPPHPVRGGWNPKGWRKEHLFSLLDQCPWHGGIYLDPCQWNLGPCGSGSWDQILAATKLAPFQDLICSLQFCSTLCYRFPSSCWQKWIFCSSFHTGMLWQHHQQMNNTWPHIFLETLLQLQ